MKSHHFGENEIQNVQGENFSELSKIIGESYFNTQQYEQALKHLKKYKGKKGKWDPYRFLPTGLCPIMKQETIHKPLSNSVKSLVKKINWPKMPIITWRNAISKNSENLLRSMHLGVRHP